MSPFSFSALAVSRSSLGSASTSPANAGRITGATTAAAAAAGILPFVALPQGRLQERPDGLLLTLGRRGRHLCRHRLRVGVRRAARLGSASLGHHAVSVPAS